LDHELLLTTLREKIHDGRFIKLISKLLDAGYLEDWRYNQTLSGVPQGSVASPILSNILLDKLDTFVTTVLIPQHTRGEKRKLNHEYDRLAGRVYRLRKQGQKEAAKKIKAQMQRLPSRDTRDPDYRRLRYTSYADDFGLAFIGPKTEAEEIKRQLPTFLRDELKLNLSEEKTLITHARNGAAKFLGYEVTTLHSDTKQTQTKNGKRKRSINGRVGLRIPHTVLREKRNRYQKGGKAVHRAELLNESDSTIISTYQLEYRGIVEYYRLAYNFHTLQLLKWIMETSLTKTLASKHKISVKKIYKKYQTELEVEGKKYKVLQATVQREGKNPLVATWCGIPLTWDIKATIQDRPGPQWNRRSGIQASHSVAHLKRDNLSFPQALFETCHDPALVPTTFSLSNR